MEGGLSWNDQLGVVRADFQRRLAQRTRHVVLRRRVGPGLARQLLARLRVVGAGGGALLELVPFGRASVPPVAVVRVVRVGLRDEARAPGPLFLPLLAWNWALSRADAEPPRDTVPISSFFLLASTRSSGSRSPQWPWSGRRGPMSNVRHLSLPALERTTRAPLLSQGDSTYIKFVRRRDRVLAHGP